MDFEGRLTYRDVENDFGTDVADFMMPKPKPYSETIEFENQVTTVSELETLRRIETSSNGMIRHLVDRHGNLRDPNDYLYLNLLADTRFRIVEPELRNQYAGVWTRDKPNESRCLTAKMYVEGYDPFNGEDRPVDDKACRLALAMCNPEQPILRGTRERDRTGGSVQMYLDVKDKCVDGERFFDGLEIPWT